MDGKDSQTNNQADGCVPGGEEKDSLESWNGSEYSSWSSEEDDGQRIGMSSLALTVTDSVVRGDIPSDHTCNGLSDSCIQFHVPDEVSEADFDNCELRSEEDAYKLYVQYARGVGFGVRKSDLHRDASGKPTRRNFVCSRAGRRETKHYQRHDRTCDHKAETRTNCMAKLMIYRDKLTDVWHVRKLVVEHNHKLTPHKFVHLIPNHRKFTDSDKAQIKTMHRYGMQTSQIFGLMAGQSGGFCSVGFSKKDLYNYIDRERRANIADGDAAVAIGYLQGKADADGMTVARYTTTETDSLANLFWADGMSRVDYHHFGDVVAFDATYKKNKYNKPLVIFSGANHHSQTCIFGFALLADERIETYQWLLEQFLDVMGNNAPTVVVTDGDDAMREAIHRVFPDATHRLCAWHLEKNATSNIKDAEFCAAFKKCIYGNFDVDQFEEFWDEVVEKHGLRGNRWVRSTYEKKEMWANAYLRGKFCAGIRTTSRCEGINGFIKRFIKCKYSILQLVQSLERVMRAYRNNELEAQFLVPLS